MRPILTRVAEWQLPETDVSTPPIINSTELEWIDWSVAGLLLVLGVVLSMILRRAVVTVLQRGTTIESMAERLLGRIVQVAVVLVALAYALTTLGVQIGPLLGALGIGGLAVALALQQTLKDLFAGVILHAQRPLRAGEEVVTGDEQGTVIDITSRAVVIRSNSGRTIFIPNSLALDREIVNLVRHGTRRTTVAIGVAYGTDLDRAHQVIHDATVGAAGVLPDLPVLILCSGLGDSSVNFDVDFWHGPVETARRETSSNVVKAVYRALGEANITIPFPQRTVWSGERSSQESPS